MSDTVDPPPTPSAARPVEPGSLLRSKNYRVLLVLASVLGVVVSVAAWGFLELIHYTQQWVYKELPGDLGFGRVPTWWPLPVLAVAGVLVAFAIIRLPGTGGHQPADGVKTGGGPTKPIELPGVVLAALASVGLGMVLGPEAPLIGLGTGLAVLAVRSAKKDAPDQVVALMAAAASFAAISSLFGSPKRPRWPR
jgi:H+/Cl- antiporter ClcA